MDIFIFISIYPSIFIFISIYLYIHYINDLSMSPRSQRQVLLLCITWSMDWRDDPDDGLITASMARAVPWQWPRWKIHRISGGSIGNMRKNVEQNVENHRFTIGNMWKEWKSRRSMWLNAEILPGKMQVLSMFCCQYSVNWVFANQ